MHRLMGAEASQTLVGGSSAVPMVNCPTRREPAAEACKESLQDDYGGTFRQAAEHLLIALRPYLTSGDQQQKAAKRLAPVAS